jgi:hypothetical protein
LYEGGIFREWCREGFAVARIPGHFELRKDVSPGPALVNCRVFRRRPLGLSDDSWDER